MSEERSKEITLSHITATCRMHAAAWCVLYELLWCCRCCEIYTHTIYRIYRVVNALNTFNCLCEHKRRFIECIALYVWIVEKPNRRWKSEHKILPGTPQSRLSAHTHSALVYEWDRITIQMKENRVPIVWYINIISAKPLEHRSIWHTVCSFALHKYCSLYRFYFFNVDQVPNCITT